MKHLGSGWLALAVVFLSVGRIEAQPTFQEAILNLRTEAQIDPLGYQWRNAYTWVTGSYLDDSLNCAVPASSDNGSVTAVTSASMTWESESKGHVTFSETGFLWAVFGGTGAADLDQTAWSYTFTTGDNHVFEVKYANGIATSSIDEPVVAGFTLIVYQDQEVIFAEDMDLETSGRLKARLSPYQTYTTVIRPNGGLSTGASLGMCTMWGDFQWQIK